VRLPHLDVKLPPNEVLCVGCFSPVQRMFASWGKINKGVQFAKRITEELTFDPVTGKTEIEEIEKTFPVSNWHRGWICSSCSSDYRTVTHTRKDGSKWYEPVVQLERSPTQSETLNPGESREMTPPHDDGFGFEDVLTTEEIHRPAFTYFSRGGQSRQVSERTSVRPQTGRKSEAQLNAEAARR
jgi:hypothetical protein